MDAAASKDLGVSPRKNWTRVGLLHFRAAATAWVCHCLDRGLDDPYFAPATPVLAPENLIFSHGHKGHLRKLGQINTASLFSTQILRSKGGHVDYFSFLLAMASRPAISVFRAKSTARQPLRDKGSQ
jgi:hypothetical protein